MVLLNLLYNSIPSSLVIIGARRFHQEKMAASTSPAQVQGDFEKQIQPENHTINDFPDKEEEHDSDDGSEIKQDGVKRVEAITKVWSPGMMWAVFILYALHCADL